MRAAHGKRRSSRLRSSWGSPETDFRHDAPAGHNLPARRSSCAASRAELGPWRLALDVYEHAYVRDFGATPDGRKQYVEAFFRNLDWDHVNRQLAQAEAAKRGADESATEGVRESGSPTQSPA